MKYRFLGFLMVLFTVFLLGACGEDVRVSNLVSAKATNWDLARNEFATVSLPIENFAIRLDLAGSETEVSSSVGSILNRAVLLNPVEFMTITSLQTFEKRKPDSVLNDLFALGETLLALDSLNKQNKGNYYRTEIQEYYLKPLQKPENLGIFEFIIRIKLRGGEVLRDTTDKILLK